MVPERFRGRHPDHRRAFFAAPKTRAMGAGRDLHGLRKDGREVPIEIGLNPIDTPEGSFVLASIIDITERKRAEEPRTAKEALGALSARSQDDLQRIQRNVLQMDGIIEGLL